MMDSTIVKQFVKFAFGIANGFNNPETLKNTIEIFDKFVQENNIESTNDLRHLHLSSINFYLGKKDPRQDNEKIINLISIHKIIVNDIIKKYNLDCDQLFEEFEREQITFKLEQGTKP